MAENQIGRNIAFKIYNADGTEFEGLVMYKSTFETVVMSLGDKITGDVYYKDNGLAVTMQEYIVYNGVKYILVNPPTIIREGMVSDNSELKGMTRYSFVFYHPMCLLGNFPFTDIAVTSGQQKYLSQNKTFSWIGNLVDFVAKLNKNLEGTEWVCEIGDTVTSEIYNKLSEVLSFDKQTIADVIKTGYDTWKVPYIVDVIASTDSRYASGKRFLVRYGLPSQEIVGSGGSPFVFEFGKGVGLKNNSRTPKNNKIITRIAGYGSENNIPYGYPQIIWTGNQDWDYTINNNPSAANSYPIYDGIVNGQRVRLIKHPFTRNHLMPSIYSDTVNKKVNPNATGYNPNIEIKDYYDAVSSPSYTYPNPINPNSPSYDIHEFEEIKPELGQAAIAGVSAYDLEHQGAISIDDAQSLLLDYYSESHNETEKIQLNRLIFNLPTATELSGHSDAASYHYDWSLKSDAYYAYIKYNSSILNFTCIVLRAAQPPAPTWDDTMDDDGNYKQSYFKITLPQLSFDLYACAAITQEMSINMRSGACIGCTFPVMVDWDDYKKNFYDADGNFDPVIGEGHPRNADKYPNSASGQITVIVQKDNSTFGTLMPNVYQYPTANDQFVILGISLPLSYVSNAESRLDDEMIQYMKDNNVYYFEYPLKFDEHFLATHTNILQQMKCNTIVRFKYNGVTIPLYIKQMSVKFGQSPLPQYDITLTDDIQVVLNPIGKAVETFRTMIEGGGVGNIDLNTLYANLDERYLSKMNDDTAAGFVRLLRGLQVGERFVTGLLGEGGVFRTESDGTTYLEVDKMYVRMKAYFDTVEIRKFLHSNGNRIASLAGIKCSRVEYIDANGDITEDATQATKFRCYFRANNNGETVTNDFVVGDLAFCKETNAKVGTGVEQHGYWRAVVGKNTLLTDEGEAWIDLSASDCLDGSDIPLAQDDIVQLGNKTDTTRQGAIIEYVGGADAPSYQIYQNINTYSLENKNYVAMGYNSSTGRAYLNVYGDFRFGSKSDSGSYLSYNAQTGILNVKAVINAQSTIGNQSIDQYIKAHQNNYDDSWIQPALDAIQEQIDGELDTWYYSGVPTLNNLPASQWTTDDLKKEHVGDLYYDKDSGLAYRFIYDNDTQQYLWSQIHDDAISEALKIANQAQDTADNKRRVFICDAQHPTPTPPYDEGDLWVNVKYPFETGALYKDDILKCINTRASGLFNIADWSKASNYTDDSALLNFVNTTYAQDLQNIGTQIDKKAETWYQDTDPSLETGWVDAEHVGDIWCDTSANGGKNTYIYRQRDGVTPAEYYWAQQAVPDAVFDKIDGKGAVYITWGSWGNNLQLKDLFIPSSTTTQGGVTYYADKVYRCIDTTTPLFQEINYTDDTTVNSIIQRYGQILNITPTAQSVGEALGYLEKVLSTGTTSIDGGIVLTNILYMKDTSTTPSIKSGISGLAQTVEEGTGYKGYGTAAWYGGGVNNGIPIDHEVSPSLANYAKSLFRFDGSGYLASGNITWNANGAVTIKNITTLSDSQNTNLLNELATFNNAFTFATSGQGSTTVLSITPNVPFTALSILENNVANAVATQAWVRQNATGTFWGNSWTFGGTVTGSLTGVVQINMTGHLIMHSGSTGIYLNSDGTGIDWHDASNAYVKTMLAFTNENNVGLITANQQLYIPSTSSLKIGDAIFEWDASNNAVKVHHTNGANVAVNFYATGGVSALGASSGGGGGGDVTWDLLASNTDTRPIALSHLTGALAGYATTSQLAGYLPLTAGSSKPLTGSLYISTTITDVALNVKSGDSQVWYSFGVDANGGYIASGATYYLCFNNGKIGVRKTSPSYELDINGTAAASNFMSTRFSGYSSSDNFTDSDGNPRPWHGLSFGGTDKTILASYEGMTFKTYEGNVSIYGGNLGIGIASPSYKLHVNGTSYISGAASFANSVTASSFIKTNGTSSQFLKADGSVDSNTYATTSQLAGYLPLTGGTLSGRLGIVTTGTDVSIGLSTSEHSGGSWNFGVDSNGGYIHASDYGVYLRFINGITTSPKLRVSNQLFCSLISETSISSDKWTDANGNNRTWHGYDYLSSNYPTNQRLVISCYEGLTLKSAGGVLVLNENGLVSASSFRGNKIYLIDTTANDVSMEMSSAGCAEHFFFGVDSQGYICGNVNHYYLKFSNGVVYASSIAKIGGTSSQFLKADGSIDSTTYATSSSLSNYLALTGGTLSGSLSLTSSLTLSCNDNALCVQTSYGSSWFGMMNQSYLHIYTDAPSIYFNKSDIYANGNLMWTAGNDGNGSGLDADLLDGQHASYFATASSLSSYMPKSGGVFSNGGGDVSIGFSSTAATKNIYFGLDSGGYIWGNGGDGYYLGFKNGYVGVGLASPSYKLDVNGDSNIRGSVAAKGIFLAGFGDSYNDSTGVARPWHGLSGNYASGTSSTEKTVLASYEGLMIHTIRGDYGFYGGNLGVGTVSPSYKLHVAGTIYSSTDITANNALYVGQGIILNPAGAATTNGGFLDFRYAGAGSYTSRIIEDASGRLYLSATNGVRIGDAVLLWDSGNNALKLQNANGVAANFYTTGGVSALGISGAVDGTVNASLIPSATGTYTLGSTTYGWKELRLASTNGSYNGRIYVDYDGINLYSANGGWFGGSRYMIEGRLVIGTQEDEQPNYDLYVAGNTYVDGTNAYFYGNVSVQSLTQRSDMRIKDVISDMTLKISTIAQAPLFRYKLKQGDGTIMVGSSAQYWDALLPEVIHRDAEGILGLDYGVTALASVISVAKEVTEHERRIARLEAENAILRAQVEDLKAA